MPGPAVCGRRNIFHAINLGSLVRTAWASVRQLVGMDVAVPFVMGMGHHGMKPVDDFTCSGFFCPISTIPLPYKCESSAEC